MKRVMLVLGALLVAGGLYVMVRPPSYATQQSVIKLGGFEANVREEKTVPPWAGGVGVCLGVLFLAMGLGARR
jgi:hypothetical protein